MPKKELMNVEFIVMEGYYLQGMEEIQPLEHTIKTLELYLRGLKVSTDEFGRAGIDKMYEGVIFKDGKPLAQCGLTNEKKLSNHIPIECKTID